MQNVLIFYLACKIDSSADSDIGAGFRFCSRNLRRREVFPIGNIPCTAVLISDWSFVAVADSLVVDAVASAAVSKAVVSFWSAQTQLCA